MNNRLYFLGKWFERNIKIVTLLIFVILIFTCIAQIILDVNTSIKLFSVYIFIILFTIFRVRLNHIPLDMSEFSSPEKGDIVVITKDFYYDGTFKKYINTSDPSRKPNTLHIKKNDEWTIYDVTILISDDWHIFMENSDGNKIVLNYIETRKYWSTKSDLRNERLKQLGI